MVPGLPQDHAKEKVPIKWFTNVSPRLVPPKRTWGVWILTHFLHYVAGYTDPFLFHFDRTHKRC